MSIGLLHIGALFLDADSQKTSPWHSLTPPTRVVCTLLIVFAIALTPNGHWQTWAVYSMAIFSIIVLSSITVSILFKRMMLESVFVSIVAIGTLFQDGGKVVWSWGIFKITTQGLTVLGSVSLKVFLCLLMVNILTLTTSPPALLNALISLRTPPLLVAILASMYRYLGISIDEFNSMRRAALSRNLLSGSRRRQRLVIGNAIGTLFIRTYERGERIYQAMLARGYKGIPTTRERSRMKKKDYISIILTTIVVLLGQIIYLVN